MRGDARSLRLPGRFGTRFTGCERPNARLSRAADGTVIERHGHTKE
jgi:hypothetical protein